MDFSSRTSKQSLLQKHTVQCSGGHPTPMGIAGRVRPCRLAEAAHRTPHGKRVAAAERNETCPIPYQIKNGWNLYHLILEVITTPKPLSSVQRRPTDSRGNSGQVRPCRRSRSGSPTTPQESGRP
ncbi:hypothetical protein NDQ53_11830 [Rossellomorea marisflavi]|uniref:hypothetical protein n=1 Tax=Rossellomorea marisflavi TaxID=189381 RepID=UPI00203E7CEF|nr:hypothetical protein [Rossellomorea marisflavi]MCM2589992.1 hypothetical protein [Rossellomorea marisflavi]